MRRLFDSVWHQGSGAWILAWAIVAVLVAPTQADEPEEKLPTGEQILDRFVEASGGVEAYAKIKNRVKIGSTQGLGGVAKIRMYGAPPSETYWELESLTGVDRRGTHDGVSWMKGQSGDVQILEGDMRERDLHDSFFNMPSKWRELYKEAKSEEIVEFHKERCYKVTLTTNMEDTETWYFSVETGLAQSVTRIVTGGMRDFEFILGWEDYRQVDGIKLPFALVRFHGENEAGRIVFESIEHNVNLPADRFIPPPEVLEKLEEADKQKAEDAKTEKSDTPADPPVIKPDEQ